jgi:ATP-dependent DNA helicase RecG
MVSKDLKNKIIISNPGGLPKGMPAKDFGKYSLARNAIIANIMQRAGFIEKLGTGITRIKQEIEKADLPEPVFHYNYFFAVEFVRVNQKEKSSEKILQIISDNKFISARELAQELKISQRAVEKNLAALKKEGNLKRIGPAKGGHWEITKNNL